MPDWCSELFSVIANPVDHYYRIVVVSYMRVFCDHEITMLFSSRRMVLGCRNLLNLVIFSILLFGYVNNENCVIRKWLLIPQATIFLCSHAGLKFRTQ